VLPNISLEGSEDTGAHDAEREAAEREKVRV
jgi:hypothetical protein